LDSVSEAEFVSAFRLTFPDCADRRKYLINRDGGGRGPVAPPVFKSTSARHNR
jgi:hypothetical protein